MILPGQDGADHINIYSKGLTELGRFLSNFASAPVILPVDGRFQSIEGYWYWLTHRDDRLRSLYGFQAKQLGKALNKVREDPDFEKKIRDACWYKLHAYPEMLKKFMASTLPFTHYYVYGGKQVDAGYEWLVEMWEFYRQYIKNGYK